MTSNTKKTKASNHLDATFNNRDEDFDKNSQSNKSESLEDF